MDAAEERMGRDVFYVAKCGLAVYDVQHLFYVIRDFFLDL
jgi:hypothetical protein